MWTGNSKSKVIFVSTKRYCFINVNILPRWIGIKIKMGYCWFGSGFNVGPVTNETTLCTLTNLFLEILFDDWHSTVHVDKKIEMVERISRGTIKGLSRLYLLFDCIHWFQTRLFMSRFCTIIGNCCNLKTDFKILRII